MRNEAHLLAGKSTYFSSLSLIFIVTTKFSLTFLTKSMRSLSTPSVYFLVFIITAKTGDTLIEMIVYIELRMTMSSRFYRCGLRYYLKQQRIGYDQQRSECVRYVQRTWVSVYADAV